MVLHINIEYKTRNPCLILSNMERLIIVLYFYFSCLNLINVTKNVSRGTCVFCKQLVLVVLFVVVCCLLKTNVIHFSVFSCVLCVFRTMMSWLLLDIGGYYIEWIIDLFMMKLISTKIYILYQNDNSILLYSIFHLR